MLSTVDRLQSFSAFYSEAPFLSCSLALLLSTLYYLEPTNDDDDDDDDDSLSYHSPTYKR